MVWLDSIADLQYYHAKAGIPCYCEILIYPGDMMLQGAFPKGSGSYTLTIETFSADGLTSYETSTANFSYYFALNPVTNQHFFNAQLNSFTGAMCTYACYVMKVQVTDTVTGLAVFTKWTERYCQSSCCDIARDITFSQEDDGIGTDVRVAFDEDGTSAPPTVPPVAAGGNFTECGEPLITLRTQFTCYDYFDGYYWATPSTVLSGSASFSFQIVTNMRGKLVKRPRAIERTYSYNCRLQKVESKRVYLFEAYEYFPAWKADEIELQLHSNQIYVDDVQYEYSSNTPFSMASECLDIFRLKTTLEDCIQRQVLGCNPDCETTNFDGAAKMFVLPSGYQGGYFYDENKNLIAEDYEGLLDYYRNTDGAYGVNEIATSPLSCETYGAFSVLSYGYVPNTFYYDAPVASNRVFATILESVEDICPTYGVTCASPVITYNWVEEQVCAAPEIGDYYVEEDTSEVITITGFGDWSDDGTTEGSLEAGYATITIGVGNPFYVEDPSSPDAPIYINGDIIALIGGNGRPANNQTFTSSNSVLTDDNVLTIDTNGFVRYFGEATTATPTEATINIIGLTYYINQ